MKRLRFRALDRVQAALSGGNNERLDHDVMERKKNCSFH